MRTFRLVIGVLAVIFFAFAIVSPPVSSNEARLTAHPKTPNVVIADGGDPLPRPWHKMAA